MQAIPTTGKIFWSYKGGSRIKASALYLLLRLISFISVTQRDIGHAGRLQFEQLCYRREKKYRRFFFIWIFFQFYYVRVIFRTIFRTNCILYSVYIAYVKWKISYIFFIYLSYIFFLLLDTHQCSLTVVMLKVPRISRLVFVKGEIHCKISTNFRDTYALSRMERLSG